MPTLTPPEYALLSYLYKNSNREAMIVMSSQRLRLKFPDQPYLLPRLVTLNYVAASPDHGGYYPTPQGVIAMEIYEDA